MPRIIWPLKKANQTTTRIFFIMVKQLLTLIVAW